MWTQWTLWHGGGGRWVLLDIDEMDDTGVTPTPVAWLWMPRLGLQ